jgi:hypothetical protein
VRQKGKGEAEVEGGQGQEADDGVEPEPPGERLIRGGMTRPRDKRR